MIDSDDEKKINFYKYVNNAWVSDGSHIVDGEEYSAFNVFNDNGKLYYTFNRGLYEGDDALFEFTMVDADTDQVIYKRSKERNGSDRSEYSVSKNGDKFVIARAEGNKPIITNFSLGSEPSTYKDTDTLSSYDPKIISSSNEDVSFVGYNTTNGKK